MARVPVLVLVLSGFVFAKGYWETDDYLEFLIAGWLALTAVGVLVFLSARSLVICLLPLMLAPYSYWLRLRHTEGLERIGPRAVEIVKSRLPAGGTIRPSAKIVVWDFQKNDLSDLHYSVPRAWRGRSTDPNLTIFLVGGTASKKVGAYYRTAPRPGEKGAATIGAPVIDAFQDTLRVAVVNWPEQTYVQWKDIEGGMPPESVEIRNGNLSNVNNHGLAFDAAVSWMRSTHAAPRPAPDLKYILSSFLPAPSTKVPQKQWTEAEARSEAIRRYPEINVANSAMNKAYLERYARMKRDRPGYFRRPDWPLRLAEEIQH